MLLLDDRCGGSVGFAGGYCKQATARRTDFPFNFTGDRR
jgi:hypothetical protein